MPLRVVYPLDYMPVENKQQQAVINDFIFDLEKWAGVKHEKISFDDIWDKQPPQQACSMSLATYMKSVS